MTNLSSRLTTNTQWAYMIAQVAASGSGVGRDTLIQQAGIDLQRWNALDRINQQDLTALWKAAESLSGQPDIGLGVLEHFNFSTIGPLAVKMMSATTLRQSIIEALHQISVISEVWTYTLTERRNIAVLKFGLADPRLDITHHSYDAFASACVRMMRDCFPTDICRLTEIRFVHDDFGLKESYQQRLGCRCSFNSQEYAICLDASLMDRPLPSANAVLYESLDSQLEHQTRKLQGIVSDIEKAILQLIASRQGISRREVAQHMGLGERTLLRRLKEIARTYKDVEEEVFVQHARQSLRRGDHMDSIAERLCYADATSLAKMLKRRTGLGIRELRR